MKQTGFSDNTPVNIRVKACVALNYTLSLRCVYEKTVSEVGKLSIGQNKANCIDAFSRRGNANIKTNNVVHVFKRFWVAQKHISIQSRTQ